MPYIAFNSGHKGLAGKSYYMSYRLVSQTIGRTLHGAGGFGTRNCFVQQTALCGGRGNHLYLAAARRVYRAESVRERGRVCGAERRIRLCRRRSYGYRRDRSRTLFGGTVRRRGTAAHGGGIRTDLRRYRKPFASRSADTSEKVFLGWFDGTGKDAVQVGEIAVGTTGDLKLYARFTDENVVKISVETGEGGKAEVNRISAVAGTEIIFSVSADYGYKIAAATLNGKDILPQIEGGRYTVQAGETDLHFAARFEKISVYTYRGGDAFFAYDSFSDTQGFMGRGIRAVRRGKYPQPREERKRRGIRRHCRGHGRSQHFRGRRDRREV